MLIHSMFAIVAWIALLCTAAPDLSPRKCFIRVSTATICLILALEIIQMVITQFTWADVFKVQILTLMPCIQGTQVIPLGI